MPMEVELKVSSPSSYLSSSRGSISRPSVEEEVPPGERVDEVDVVSQTGPSRPDSQALAMS